MVLRQPLLNTCFRSDSEISFVGRIRLLAIQSFGSWALHSFRFVLRTGNIDRWIFKDDVSCFQSSIAIQEAIDKEAVGITSPIVGHLNIIHLPTLILLSFVP